MSGFERLPKNTPESISGLTLEELRKKPIYKKVKKFLVYLATFSSLTVAAELGTKHSIVAEKDKQEEVVKNEYTPITLEQAEQLREQRQYIESEIGPRVLDFLSEMHLAGQLEESRELKIEGNYKVGIENSILKALWSEGDSYPRGWIDENIDQIDIVDPSSIQSPVYGKEGQQYIGGANDKNIMTLGILDGLSKKEQLAALDWVFAHESGHLNDWRNDHSAKYHERVDLLARTHQRMSAPDRFEEIGGSGYGDMETVQNREQHQFYLVSEYWGTICEYYFTFPEILKEKSPNDFALVDAWVKRQDPEFDPFVAATNRNNIINEIDK